MVSIKYLTDSEVAATILDKLARKNKWGAAHTSSDKIVRRISRKIRGKGKRVRKVLKGLIKDGYVLKKITGYGLEISLNPHKSREITEIIERLLNSFQVPKS